MKILKENFLVIHKFLNLQSKIHWSNNSKKKKKGGCHRPKYQPRVHLSYKNMK